jgi:hypothetical protein
MKTAYIDLIKYCLKQNCLISIFDGEEWSIKRSNKFRSIIEEIKAVELSEIRIRDSLGNTVGWAEILPYGVGPDETVIDHSDNEFMNKWANNYDH